MGVCALNMEAMTVFRSGGNGLAPANLEYVKSDAGQEEPEVVGSDTELTTHLPPSHLAPRGGWTRYAEYITFLSTVKEKCTGKSGSF